MVSSLIKNYLRTDYLPHIWCSGCGNGILVRNLAQALDNLKLDMDKVVVVSGIGCSSRAAGYMNCNTLHTTHGRAIAFATGVKLANPELTVIVVTGDGDCAAIGGNHLIHAARRNIDLTVLVMNNNIYGMTGGQSSPTTPVGDSASTVPYGNIERPFDIATLALGCGASYVAKGDTYHVQKTTELIQGGIVHKGFALIDCASVCHVYYGRKNGKGDAVDMLKWQKENAVIKDGFDGEPNSAIPRDKLVIGLISKSDAPEFVEEYLKLVDKQSGKGDA